MAKNTSSKNVRTLTSVSAVETALPPAPVVDSPKVGVVAKGARAKAAKGSGALSRGERRARVYSRLAKSLAKQAARWEGGNDYAKEVASMLRGVVTGLEDCSHHIAHNNVEMPGGGATGARGDLDLTLGALVEIRAAARKHYELLLSTEDMDRLTIKRAAGKKVVVTGSDGMAVVVSVAHLGPVGGSAARDEKRAAKKARIAAKYDAAKGTESF